MCEDVSWPGYIWLSWILPELAVEIQWVGERDLNLQRCSFACLLLISMSANQPCLSDLNKVSYITGCNLHANTCYKAGTGDMVTSFDPEHITWFQDLSFHYEPHSHPSLSTREGLFNSVPLTQRPNTIPISVPSAAHSKREANESLSFLVNCNTGHQISPFTLPSSLLMHKARQNQMKARA